MGYKFRNDVICWQISKSIKVFFFIFALVLTPSEILTSQIFYLQKVGHGVHFLQRCHSMVNIKIYKSHHMYFSFSSNRIKY